MDREEPPEVDRETETGDLFGGPPDTKEAEALAVLADYWAFSISDRDWRWFASSCENWEDSGLEVASTILAATTRRGDVPKDWRRALSNWFRKESEFRERDRAGDDDEPASSATWNEELPDDVEPAEARDAWAWYRSTDRGAVYSGTMGYRQTRYVVDEFRKSSGA